MSVYLSLIVPTMRVGGIDVLLDSLAAQSFTDFELILVDALYPHRAALVKQAAWERFLKVIHVAPEPNTFPLANYCAAMNTGLAHASGEVVLFLTDYSRLPPGLLKTHAEFHKRTDENAGLMGPHRYIRLYRNMPIYKQGAIDEYANDLAAGYMNPYLIHSGTAQDEPSEAWEVDEGNIAEHDADPKLRHPAGSIDSINFHCKNESVKLSKALATGGFCEALDGSHGYQDSDMAGRLDKVGVKWTLDPTAVIDIVNPRGIFPFAKRVRDFRDNERIWIANKAAGYPQTNRRSLLERRRETGIGAVGDQILVGNLGSDKRRALEQKGVKLTCEIERKPLRVVMIYGEFCSAIHGHFDIPGLYKKHGLTGSESSFFNLARTLAERGHEVAVFCHTETEVIHESGFAAIPISRLPGLPALEDVDAVVSWSEPDYLRFAPNGARRFCDQQLNDFGYAGGSWYRGVPASILHSLPPIDWKSLVDVWVSPSQSHADRIMKADGLTARVIPNSVDLDLFASEKCSSCGGAGCHYNDNGRDGFDCESCNATGSGKSNVRHSHRAIYCSSPDRGLHHLLGIWPLVRHRVPDAELKIFYRLAPWLAAVRDAPNESGRRARFIEEVLPRLTRMGVEVVDLVPNERMARELQSAQVLAYPCDPANHYTEGFGCSVLDAAAAGCLPVISTADALPSVHGKAAAVVSGLQHETWADAICTIMETNTRQKEWDFNMREHAECHSRERITDIWETAFRGE